MVTPWLQVCSCVHTCSWMHQLQPQRLLTHPWHLAMFKKTGKKMAKKLQIAPPLLKPAKNKQPREQRPLAGAGDSRPSPRQLLDGAAVEEGELRLCHRHVPEAQRKCHDDKLCDQARKQTSGVRGHGSGAFILHGNHLTKHLSLLHSTLKMKLRSKEKKCRTQKH